MAAVTVNSVAYNYIGNRRMICANLSVANTNTWVTGLVQIDAFSIDSSATTAMGGTISGGTITFATGGADAAANVMVVGV